MASNKAKTASRQYRKSEAYQQKLAQTRGFSKANKFNEYMNTNFYSSSISVAEMREVRQALAKRANQRLVRLERAQSAIVGNNFGETGAARVAKNYLKEEKRYRGTADKLRFDERISKNLSRKQLMKEITTLQDFLGSVSSTVSGAKKLEQERLKRFKDKGLEAVAKTKEFYDFLGSEDYKYLVGQKGENFDSETLIDMYQRASDSGATPKEIQDAFHSYIDKRMEVDDYKSSLEHLNDAFGGAEFFNTGRSK